MDAGAPRETERDSVRGERDHDTVISRVREFPGTQSRVVVARAWQVGVMCADASRALFAVSRVVVTVCACQWMGIAG